MTDVVDEHGVMERRAAVAYAEHGWPVLPGSSWDGLHWAHPDRVMPTNGLRPVMARNLATSDTVTVTERWSRADGQTPSVLLRTGEAFAVVHVYAPLAVKVLDSNAFRVAPGPVIFRPDLECAYFLVCPDETVVVPDDAPPGEVLPLARGELIAAPPTATPNGKVSWWYSPDECGWRLMTAHALTAGLRAAVESIANG